MEIRHSCNRRDFQRYNTENIRMKVCPYFDFPENQAVFHVPYAEGDILACIGRQP